MYEHAPKKLFFHLDFRIHMLTHSSTESVHKIRNMMVTNVCLFEAF